MITITDPPDLSSFAPGKIIAVGLNYADHVAEVPGSSHPEAPVLFMKPQSSLIGHGGAIVIPPGADPVDHEAELAVVIGRRAHGVRRDEAAVGPVQRIEGALVFRGKLRAGPKGHTGR